MTLESDHALSAVARRLVGIIRGEPGIHFRGLERAAGLTSPGQLRHHLDQLQRRDLVVELQDGGFHRFFLAGEQDRNLRRRMARLSRPIPRRIATVLLEKPLNRSTLRRQLGCADSTLGYYLCRMEESGDLVKHTERARAYYALADPESVREVLEAQQGERLFYAPPTAPVAGSLAEQEARPSVAWHATPAVTMVPGRRR